MYLQKLEAVGFKSFAEKTSLEFLAPSGESKGVTGIVGPNGSGKSNVADAVRWVLGEQSAKLLRGKKAEDVIFSGSEKRAKSNFAEVTLHLNNEDGALPLDYSEVAISRRVYRSGESEYLINKNKVRLSDIQLLLAQANFGARTYSVIGQGMIGDILVASPQERKEFFDEAAGVKQFQIKRNQSVNKMAAARENLGQAEMLIAEIEPRLRSLSRQVRRLSERESLEEELHGHLHRYYGLQWSDLAGKLGAVQTRVAELDAQWKEKESTLESARAELAALEKQETGDSTYSALQAAYEKLLERKNALHSRELQAKSRQEIAREVKKQTRTVMPLSKIIETVGVLGDTQSDAIAALKKATTLDTAKATASSFEGVHVAMTSLRDDLERPATAESDTKAAEDPAVTKELATIAADRTALEPEITKAQAAMRSYAEGESRIKERFFGLQRALQERINAAHALERQLSEQRIESARLETRRDTLEREMVAELGERMERVTQGFDAAADGLAPEALLPEIDRLKYQLQLIGGIDPEVVREHRETQERFDYLQSQVTDLVKAIDDLDRVIAELDITIKARSEAAFKKLNADFDRYFKTLFGGGSAGLVQIKELQDENVADSDTAADGAITNDGSDTDNVKKVRKPVIAGIDIHATPPGKKISNVTMLSGGERAMTSIALICAILVNNPSPFVVLDEVDAALDESNAARFADILAELATSTQFIVITHNRYTMRNANVLYGVTMRDDGTSALLSINLQEVDTLRNDKRQQKAAA